MKKEWFVLHTLSGQETKVKESLERRMKQEEMEDYISEVLIPTEKVSEVKKGKRTTTIKMNDERTITDGDDIETIKMGDKTTTVKMGNETVSIKMGKQSTDAMQSIELKCGGSSIKMDPMSITIKSMTVKIEGSMMFEAKGGISAKVEGGAMCTIKGGMVMIN